MEFEFRLGCRPNASLGPELANVTVVHICARRLLVASLTGFLCLFTILGNAFALSAIFTNHKLRKKLTSIIIVNLAMADFLVGLFVMPFGVMQLVVEDKWVLGAFACRLWVSLDVICCTASIVTLCVISIDRFLGVHHPLRYSLIVTRKRLYVAAASIWVFSVSVLLVTVRYDLGRRSRECNVGTELRYVTQSVVLSFYIPLTLILIAYFKIYQVTKVREQSLFMGIVYSAKRPGDIQIMADSSSAAPRGTSKSPSFTSLMSTHSRRFLRRSRRTKQTPPTPVSAPAGLRMHVGGGAAGESRLEKQRRFYKYHKKSAKTLGLVVGCFLFCWLPFFLLYPIQEIWGFIPSLLMEILTWLGYSNSGINPVIYALTVRNFSGLRETFGAQCYGLCRCVFGERISASTVSRFRLSASGDEEEEGPGRRKDHSVGSFSDVIANHSQRPRPASHRLRAGPSLSSNSVGVGVEDVVIAAEEETSGVDCSTPSFHVRVHQLSQPLVDWEDGGGRWSRGVELRESGVQTEFGFYDFRVDLAAYLRFFNPKRSDV